jgi:hypothetical protein
MHGKVECPPVELVSYPGKVVPFHKPIRVNTDFLAHVQRFEDIVHATAIEFYGRPPTAMRHYGSYYCRRIRTWPYLISEHGLGNALDVGGFEFARLKRGDAEHIDPKWRGRFAVSMGKNWKEQGSVHQQFLHELARRTIAKEGLFRVILGPADPKHHDHFHFDMAPFRIVNVF